jgi:uncharacterized protein YjbI with pentapeptide repeats
MAEQFSVLDELFEIISNIEKYDSPDKIDDLKRELIFLRDNDPTAAILIADYEENLSDVLTNFSPSNVGYVFCFPGVRTNGELVSIPGNVKLVPVSTALSGFNFMNVTINDCALFAGAYLRNCNFSSCDLTGMDFTGADLTGAILSHAILSGAKLHNANVSGATFQGATMPDSIDTRARLKEVLGKGNWNPLTTIWVDGSPIGN